MADQSQLFSFLILTDSESRQSKMSGILTIGTHEKDPCRGQTAEVLVPVGHRKVCEKRP